MREKKNNGRKKIEGGAREFGIRPGG